MTDHLGDVLLRVARRLRRAHADALAPLGINPHQARALRLAAQHTPIRPTALAGLLHITTRSATEVIDGLQASGWLERHPDPADRRATLLELTDAGSTLVAQLNAVRAADAERFFAALTDAERRTLAELLGRLADGPAPTAA